MSILNRKRKISSSDSENENSSRNYKSDNYLILEFHCGNKNNYFDNAKCNRGAQIDESDEESEESCDESNILFSTFLSNVRKNFEGIKNGVFNPTKHPVKC